MHFRFWLTKRKLESTYLNPVMIKDKVSRTYLKVKDHTVSGEDFELIYNSELDMLETFPQPSEEHLFKYYDSEDYISHTDSKKTLLEKIYQKVKGIALKKKLNLINSFQAQDKNLLDIGCGTGDFLKIALGDGWNITGVEPDKNARALANNKIGNSVFDIDQLQRFEKQIFDVITLWHVLEHLPKLNLQLDLFKSLLKPNGVLIVAVPNFKSYDAKYYKSFWAAFDAPRHLWHFSKASISKLSRKHNLKILKILPMSFDAYYVSLLSEKYKNGFMNPLKAFWVAWQSNWSARRTGEYSSLIYIIKKEQNRN